jgi:GGDEF domain-containing protein
MPCQTLYVLVVEDSEDWNARLVEAIARIFVRQKFAATIDEAKSTIYSAGDVERAIEIIDNPDVKLNLVTMDIDLANDPSSGDGLTLLELLRKKQAQSIRLVVSGRGGDPTIIGPSYQRHRVFAVLDKAKASTELKPTLQAAVMMALASCLKDEGQHADAVGIIEQAIEEAPEANYISILEELKSEIASLQTAINLDQVTGLPNAEVVHEKLRELLESQARWEFSLIGIENYEPFRSTYTSLEGTEAIKNVAQCLNDIVDSYKSSNAAAQKDGLFLGYLGAEQFAMLSYGNHIEGLVNQANNQFSQSVNRIYRAADLTRDNKNKIVGFRTSTGEIAPLMQISSVFRKTGQGNKNFADIGQILSSTDFGSSDLGW